MIIHEWSNETGISWAKKDYKKRLVKYSAMITSIASKFSLSKSTFSIFDSLKKNVNRLLQKGRTNWSVDWLANDIKSITTSENTRQKYKYWLLKILLLSLIVLFYGFRLWRLVASAAVVLLSPPPSKSVAHQLGTFPKTLPTPRSDAVRPFNHQLQKEIKCIAAATVLCFWTSFLETMKRGNYKTYSLSDAYKLNIARDNIVILWLKMEDKICNMITLFYFNLSVQRWSGCCIKTLLTVSWGGKDWFKQTTIHLHLALPFIYFNALLGTSLIVLFRPLSDASYDDELRMISAWPVCLLFSLQHVNMISKRSMHLTVFRYQY